MFSRNRSRIPQARGCQKTYIYTRLHNKTNDEIEKQGIQKLLQIQNEMPGICETLGIKYHKIDASQNIEAIAKQIEEIIG